MSSCNCRPYKNVLVVASHPDDECISMAGTISRHVHAGDTVNVLLLSKGPMSRTDADIAVIKRSHDSAVNASRILGYTVNWADFPDQQFDSVSLLEITQTIEREIEKVKADVVYTHSECERNFDHRLTHDATMDATRLSVNEVYCYETPSSTEWSDKRFDPNYYVDITDTFDLKKQGLLCYNSEMRESPHPRSIQYIEALARTRGGEIGVELAESFYQVKRLG